MSSDLTFITNENDRSLAERFRVLLRGNTRAFDCLVGYFYLSGFRRLADALQPTEKIRILIGLSTDQPTFSLLSQAKEQMRLDLRSHAEAKEAVPGEILAELEHAEDSSEVEGGIRQFVEWVKSGKLQVRVYPSAKLHAKLYIMSFVDGHIDKGRVVTGSSNFSQSGLVDNLEFNVELKNRADYDFALAKFNELWAQSVEVSEAYVQTIELRSPFAQFTPHELYLKFLYEYFKAELSRNQDPDSVYLPARFKKLKYQDDAVTAARRTLDEYGGVFLSDVVGLGKTYMAALLAQQLPGRTLVIAPPALPAEALVATDGRPRIGDAFFVGDGFVSGQFLPIVGIHRPADLRPRRFVEGVQELPDRGVESVERLLAGVAQVGNVQRECLGETAAGVEIVPDDHIVRKPTVRRLHGIGEGCCDFDVTASKRIRLRGFPEGRCRRIWVGPAGGRTRRG